ncbi:DNA polymerase III subunit beta [Vibrio barjaei]|uniref:DNA polymerase III subunit beta n=1 Tax=Vibrio barjaei TaxID=1676683 RepID=UPI002283FBAC|nr:DNA polymerase III subunit beta [Vibrio barjaei]MCY9870348.1 DNA polymerase III subunit beta [Vibrio barjaei]
MKFLIQQDKLLGALNSLSGCVGNKNAMPILDKVLFQASDKGVIMIASNGELEQRVKIPVEASVLEVEEKGKATIPHRKMLDIARNLNSDRLITIKTEQNETIMTSGRSRFKMKGDEPREFPFIPDLNEPVSISVSAEVLSRSIGLVGPSMANQDVRYYLNGMFVEVLDGILTFIGTDGHRLNSVHSTAFQSSADFSRIVPRNAVQEMDKFIKGLSEVTLQFDGSHMRIVHSTGEITTKLVDGRYPDYRRVIPAKTTGDTVITVDKGDLSSALSRVAILANEKFRGVKVSLKSGELLLSSNNPQQEEAEESLDVDQSGSDIEIGFNVQYLMQAIMLCEDNLVRIHLSGSSKAGLVESVESQSDYTAANVVMPIRL